MEIIRESGDLQAVIFYIGGVECLANYSGLAGFGESSWETSEATGSSLATGKFHCSDVSDPKLLRALVLGGWLAEAAHKHKADSDNLAEWVADPEIPYRKLRRAITTRMLPRVDLDRIEGWTKTDLVEVLQVLSAGWPSIDQKALGRGLRTAICYQDRFLEDLSVEKEPEDI